MKYEMILLERCFHLRVLGEESLQGYDELLERLISHDSWKSGSPILFDETKADHAQMGADDVEGVVALIIKYRKSLGNSKIAVVASNDRLYSLNLTIEGLLRQLDELGIEMKTFRAIYEAVEWLEVSRDR